MNTRSWLDHFRRNEHRTPAGLAGPIALPERLRAPLARALRTFQAGETGEGRIVHQARAAAPGDVEFQEALRLYIAEEGRHAKELGMLVRALGGAEHAPVATARAFELARRAIGFWTKMAILTAAEVVGIVFYDLLAERVPNAGLSAVVARISHEERAHLLFQRDAFAAWARGGVAPRAHEAFVTVALAAATAAAIGVFAIDQRALLSELGVGPRELGERTRAVARWVFETPSDANRLTPSASAEPSRGASPFGWLDAA
jgi:hypothetical protein